VHLTDGRFLVEKRCVEIGKAITRSVVRHGLPPKARLHSDLNMHEQNALCGIKASSVNDRMLSF
ncbi:MAG TPA: hypothetical protein VJ728_13330, partial [Candidatus Binataceae bacterium]|nr:hypothetical protein [Candidatus Binataceae bacterium]